MRKYKHALMLSLSGLLSRWSASLARRVIRELPEPDNQPSLPLGWRR